jgi:hypothetical protein
MSCPLLAQSGLGKVVPPNVRFRGNADIEIGKQKRANSAASRPSVPRLHQVTPLCEASVAPTIKVSLQNVPFRLFFLGRLFQNVQIPRLATTSEDLCSCSPMIRACDDAP